MSAPVPISHPLLTQGGIRHGFFTRRGGVSTGLYEGLNTGLGSADDPAMVGENRRRVAGAMGGGPDDLAGCYQIHSAITRVADGPWRGDRPDGDAVVSRTPGVICAVLTADCAPVLLADAEAGVVGAVHAGWKGALGGIVHSAVTAMEALGARPGRIEDTDSNTVQGQVHLGGSELERAAVSRAIWQPPAGPAAARQ
jgi:copper oxidase (laccase) domain-containing protein